MSVNEIDNYSLFISLINVVFNDGSCPLPESGEATHFRPAEKSKSLLWVETGIVISMLGKFYLTVSSVLSRLVIFIGSKLWQVSTKQLLSCILPLLFF